VTLLMTPTPDQVHYLLPNPLGPYHHQVEQVGKLSYKVWLVHECDYDYACGRQVKTIWGFIRHGKVYAPKNAKTAQVKSLCNLTDAYKLSPFTSMPLILTGLDLL